MRGSASRGWGAGRGRGLLQTIGKSGHKANPEFLRIGQRKFSAVSLVLFFHCRFDVAMVSMFWLAAGLGLPPSLPARYPDGTPNYGVVLFFASYILVLNWTLLQARCSFPLTRPDALWGKKFKKQEFSGFEHNGPQGNGWYAHHRDISCACCSTALS